MKPPRGALVVDASVLIAIARGRASTAVARAAEVCQLVVTDIALNEARRRIELGLKRPELVPILQALAEDMTVVPLASLLDSLEAAEATLKDAVASRNGSTRDAHVLSCAWAIDADIWTFDRDFAGTGVATWSTANLLRALTKAEAA